jgi:membrane fusion protein (multidrug efflux system)
LRCFKTLDKNSLIMPAMHLSSGRISFQTVAVLVILGVGSWFGVREFNERLIFIKETDARIAAPMVTVSSRVEGWLTDVTVEEGARVEPGAPIARIDGRRTHLELSRVRVELGAIAAERARLVAERHMIVEQMRTQLTSRDSRVEAAAAMVQSLAPQLALAQAERDRSKKLFGDGVLSKSAVDQASNTVYQLEGDYLSAVARQAEAQSERAEVVADGNRTEVLDKELAKLTHDEELARVRIQRQEMELDDRTVRSPGSGLIGRVFVEDGEYVRAGQRLAVMHDPGAVRVDANIKETELNRLKVGQRVNVLVDAYPDQTFTGHVVRIGNSTTATFSLLPNPNPSGNFTKITQRVPVRIELTELDAKLHPGMMVEVHIDVR